MNHAAALLPRAQALHDLAKLLAKQAAELHNSVCIASAAAGDSDLAAAENDAMFITVYLRRAVECAERAITNLDCADTLAQMPNADERVRA